MNKQVLTERFLSLSAASIFFYYSLVLFVSSFIFGVFYAYEYAWQGWYHLALTLIFLVLSTSYLLKEDFYIFSKKDTIITILLFAGSFGLRSFWINSNLWLDELIQVSCVFDFTEKNIVRCAALQQQPPNDYYFTTLGVFLFGKSSFGAKFFSSFFSSGVVSLVYLACRRFSALPLSFIAALTVSINPYVLYNAAQARPISHCLFVSVLILLFCFDFKKYKNIKIFFPTLVGLMFAFLCTTSFQTAITLFVTSIIACLVILVSKRDRANAFVYALSATIAVLLFTPLLEYILSLSSFMLDVPKPSFYEAVEQFDFFYISRFIDALSISVGLVYGGLFIAFVILIVSLKMKRRHLFSFIYLLLFPVIFYFMFKLTLPPSERFSMRYFLIYVPYATVVSCYFVSESLKIYSVKLLYLILFAPMIYLGFISHGRHYMNTVNQVHINGLGWKRVFWLLDKESQTKPDKLRDWHVLTTTNIPGDFQLCGAVGEHIFASPIDKFKVHVHLLKRNHCSFIRFIIRSLIDGYRPEYIYFMFSKQNSHFSKIKVNDLTGIEHELIDETSKYFMFKVKIDENIAQSIISFYKEVKLKVSDGIHMHQVDLLISYLYAYQGKFKEALDVINRLIEKYEFNKDYLKKLHKHKAGIKSIELGEVKIEDFFKSKY